jgi:hypothetical protein
LAALSFFYAFGLHLFSVHQEIRFLLPALPFLHLLVGRTIFELLTSTTNDGRISSLEQQTTASGKSSRDDGATRDVRQKYKKALIVSISFLMQALGVAYLILFHQVLLSFGRRDTHFIFLWSMCLKKYNVSVCVAAEWHRGGGALDWTGHSGSFNTIPSVPPCGRHKRDRSTSNSSSWHEPAC